MAAPELIIQALDKLMENAVSFSAAGAPVQLALEPVAEDWKLSVRNQGPLLPPAMANTLFDPMVSAREASSEELHLGLGLHVVRLICDYHRGHAEARNVHDPDGVVVSMFLPRS